jgi:1-phosphofructokinase family hexose kinase
MIVTVTLNPGLDRTLLVPEILFNDVLRAAQSQQNAAGKGLNVSRALKALGVESLATGLLGGRTGQMLVDGLNALEIRHDFVTIAGETRTNVVILEGDSQRYVKVNEAGPTITDAEQRAFLDKVTAIAAPGDDWVFCGALTPGIQPNYYQSLIDIVQERGCRAFFDTSGEPLRLGCAARPFLVKPNLIEAEEATGIRVQDEAGAARAVRHFLNLGVSLVALSMGENGLLLASNQESVRVHCPRITVRNPTGAGDALLAGLVFGLSQKLPLEDVARWGVASGSAAAAREDTSFGDLAEVRALFERTG